MARSIIDSYDYQDGVLKALYSNKSEVVDLPFAPDKLLVDRRLPNELSLVDLSNKIHLGGCPVLTSFR